MSCSNPSLAVDYGLKDNGKRLIRFLPRRVDFDFQYYKEKFGDNLLVLPCGKCEGCILARRKMWSLRAYAESLYHKENCFVTLTYDDDHYSKRDVKKDYQRFIRALRDRDIEVRYFGCCEEGALTHRQHHHIVLFGFFPGDVKYFSKSKSGFPQYTSQLLTMVWNKGFVTVSDFTPEVAGYVAGYVDKKYKTRECFIYMSKKPGLGEQYFLDHYEEMYRTDSLVVNFGSHIARVPRYFDKLAEKIGVDLSDLKEERVKSMNISLYKEMRDLGICHYEDYLNHHGFIMKDKLEHKKRGL